MSSKTLSAIVAIVAIVLVLVVGVVVIHTSPYFLWAALPEDASIKLSLEMKGPLHSLLANFSGQFNPDHLLPFPDNTVARLAYATGVGSERAVIVPKLASQSRLAKTLQSQGWHTQRLGLLLLARRGEASAEPFSPPKTLIRQGFNNVITRLTRDRLPVKPHLLLSLAPGSGKFFTDPITVVGRSQRQALVFHVRRDGQFFQENLPPLTSPSGLHAALPGSFIAQLPPEVKNDWNEFLRREFHFTASRPDIVSDLSTFSHAEVHVTAASSSLVSKAETDKFLQLVQEWASQEIAHRNPVTGAFRLPDGTLGYEKRPSPATAAFTEPPDSGGCRGGLLPATFLCKNADGALLTTTRDGASQAASFPPFPGAQWYVILDETFSRKVALPGITSIVAWGNSAGGTVVLPLLIKNE